MKNRKSGRRIGWAALAALQASGLYAADVVSTWNNTTSTWSNATRWNNVPAAGGFPHNGNAGVATYDAVIGGGSITLDVNVSIQKLTLSAGTLTGGSNITVNDLFTFSGGTLSGAGTLNAAGGINFSGGNRSITTRTFNASGSATWSAGNITTSGTAPYNNAGTLTTNFDGMFSGSGLFNNFGVFRKSAGTSTTEFSADFNNFGSVFVETGTLLLAGAGSASGSFTASNGAAIDFDSDYTLAAGASLSGAGTFRISDALTVSGNVNASNVQFLAGGSLAGGGDFLPAVLTWNAGTMTGTGRTLIGPAGTLNVAGQLTSSGRVIGSSGITNWTAGNIALNSNAPFHNSGTLTTSFDGTLSGTGAFNNTGNFRKTAGGTASTTFTADFNNFGSTVVESGRLVINGGGTASGSFFASNGATIEFDLSYTLAPAASLSGPATTASSARSPSMATSRRRISPSPVVEISPAAATSPQPPSPGPPAP